MSKKDLVSKRTRQLIPSRIRQLLDEANKLKKQGKDIIELNKGQPDFPPPKYIFEKLRDLLQFDPMPYTPNKGAEELRQTISSYINHAHGLKIDSDSEVLVSAGGSEGLASVLFCLIEERDEVIIPTPAWPAYQKLVTLAGGQSVNLPCRDYSQYKIQLDNLEQLITNKTKLIVLNNPNNPTGACYSLTEQEAIARLAQKHNVLILVDETYDSFYFGKGHFSSFLQTHGALDHCIYLNSFSKSFSLTGFRVGYVLARKSLLDEINKVHQNIVIAAPTISQLAANEALKNPASSDFLQEARSEYKTRADLYKNFFSEIQIDIGSPEGGIFIFAHMPVAGKRSAQIANELLNYHGVACVPGIEFGEEFDHHLRLSLAATPTAIKEGIRRIGAYLKANQK